MRNHHRFVFQLKNGVKFVFRSREALMEFIADYTSIFGE